MKVPALTRFFQGRRVLFGVVVVAGVLKLVSLLTGPTELAAYPEDQVLRAAEVEGVQYRVAKDGNVFRVIEERGTWTWVDRVFDPEEIARTFVREDGVLYCVDHDSGRRYEMQKHFSDGFEELPEGVAGLRRLIGEERKWTELTLQTPETPSIADYVALRTEILKGGADFKDASVAPSKLQAHGGQQSLRCSVPAKSGSMVCTKASLATGLVYFEENEDVWFQAWYRIDGDTKPFTLADLECRYVQESPGLRLMLFDGETLGVELKALDKPKYQQVPENRLRFPVDQWVQVTWQMTLHATHGKVRVWQDGVLVVDGTGPTLPFTGVMYNSLEVGISAHSFGDTPATLFVDDVVITTTPLINGPQGPEHVTK